MEKVTVSTTGTCTTRHADEDHRDLVVQARVQDLLRLGLPNEVLVKIISFLPETRDRVKLRYVSKPGNKKHK